MASETLTISQNYFIDSDGVNSAWCDAVKLLDVTPGGTSVTSVDASTQQSGDDRIFVPGKLKDNGEVTLSHHHQPDLRPVVGAGGIDTLEEFVVTYPDSQTDTFEGFILSSEPDDHVLDGKMMATTVIKISGAITRSTP